MGSREKYFVEKNGPDRNGSTGGKYFEACSHPRGFVCQGIKSLGFKKKMIMKVLKRMPGKRLKMFAAFFAQSGIALTHTNGFFISIHLRFLDRFEDPAGDETIVFIFQCFLMALCLYKICHKINKWFRTMICSAVRGVGPPSFGLPVLPSKADPPSSSLQERIGVQGEGVKERKGKKGDKPSAAPRQATRRRRQRPSSEAPRRRDLRHQEGKQQEEGSRSQEIRVNLRIFQELPIILKVC